MAYQTLSAFYDKLTDDQPYDQWLEIVQRYLPKSHITSILDLGCGTGTLTEKFLSFSDQVIGMDLSEEMVIYAQQKSNDVSWFVGNMADFQLSQRFDAITILCDSLNYLSDEEDVLATFNHVYQHLNHEGVLIFDVHTTHKMDTQFNGETYLDDRENLTLVWQTEAGELPHSVWHDLIFFVQEEDGQYTRHDETQFQRTLDKSIYQSMLESIGFKNIQTFYDFNPECHDAKSDRLFFVASK
ncbi:MULTISPECIES: class I SAM-dependent methyltransferase [unclassified Staphylococcus]|uniref:class I SAM-dependent DNA methyltransferase n=1 Tax=unclassified Staphylococcus TaxID=91994 RepID=UPI0021D21266|nr:MULTISPECIES: class I SAM-dependent methyltransferase [unclassified Staphylococcus]UXR75212.1 class I SAM-dependent methyltransferase [Staphylococcus sp. IVB6233]UXR79412.1 class I SAM-dependent methyltransferase [Staphylococcus sp. IVB6218]